MEQLIILAIIGIISAIFGKKKEQPSTKERKPAMTRPDQPATPDPMRKLKEMSKELFEEIEREFQLPDDEEPPSRQTPKSAPAPAKPASQPKVTISPKRETAPVVKVKDKLDLATTRDKTSVEPHQGRLSAHQGKQVWSPPVEHHEMIPKNEEDLIKGIIFSEILGPPKSKQ